MYNQKGFSLLELIVVVAVVAVVTGIVIPVYFSMKPTIRVNGAARQIQGDFMWARMRAVSENNDYVIAFGEPNKILTNNTYYIYDDDDGDFNTAGTETGELVKTIVIPNDYEAVGYGYISGIKETDNSTNLSGDAVTFNSGSATKPIWFSFRPTGRPNILGSIYLILDEDLTNNRKDRMRAITISTAGRVKIWNYNAVTDKWD